MVDQKAQYFHILTLLVLAVPQTVSAKERPVGTVPADAGCLTSINAARLPGKMPVQLVRAISTVEAGRLDGRTHRVSPWPWTINVYGNGYFYPTKTEAMAAVLVLQAAGIQSIDVGCMQINLMYHPQAFASLDQAFDPSVNVAYAVGFLIQLFRQTGSWPEAAAAYHSQTSEIGAEYEKRVMALYPMKQAEAVKPVETSGTMVPGPTPEMLRLQRESQQDQDRLRTMFGGPIANGAPASKPARLARVAGHVTAAVKVATGARKKLLQLVDRSWLIGASTN